MPTIDVYTGFRFHPAQQAMHDHPARYKVGCCGRRTGKTKYAIAEAGIASGQGGRVGYFAPDYSKSQDVWRELKILLEPVMTDKSEQQHRIELMTGGMIEVWSMVSDSAGLSRSYDLAIIDEAAIGDFRTMWTTNIRPTLTDRRGKAIFLSSPRGFNWFYDLWVRGQDALKFPSWKSWQFPTSVNPHLPADEIEDARQTLTEIEFAQEYLAEFTSDATQVFRNLKHCNKAVLQSAAIPGHAYVIGGDIARVNDYSVFMVIDLSTTPKQLVHIDVSQGAAFEHQIDRLGFLCQRFNPMVVMLEDNANLMMIEQSWLSGLPIMVFHTTNVTKVFAVQKLAMAFEREELWIPDDTVLIGQLNAYRPSRTKDGLIKYGAPSGLHDDYVSALMITHWAAAEQTVGEAGYYRFG